MILDDDDRGSLLPILTKVPVPSHLICERILSSVLNFRDTLEIAYPDKTRKPLGDAI